MWYLEWGWNPIFFFVMLGITGALAYWLSARGFMVAWLLPAIVWFFGFNWGFPHDIWFKFVFWVLVIAALVIALTPWIGVGSWARWPVFMMAIMTVLLLGTLLMTDDDKGDGMLSDSRGGIFGDGEYDSTEDTPLSTNSLSPSATPTAPNQVSSETVEPSPTTTVTVTVTATPRSTPEGDEPNGQAEERHWYGDLPTVPGGTCPEILGWDSLVKCVEDNNLDYYIRALNARAAQTGFDWNDAKRWAAARTPEGNLPEARYVQVYGVAKSEAEIRDYSLEMTDIELRWVRQPATFENTGGIDDGRVKDFPYTPPPDRQLRVGLMPLILNDDGEVTGVRGDQGYVLVDCLNIVSGN